MATEKQLIDANAMKHRLEAHIATAIYKGINNIPTSYESCNPTEYLKGYERGAIETANLALGHPLVDAVEVVRCKDCKYYTEQKRRCDHPCQDWDVECYDQWLEMEPGDFCSYGERRGRMNERNLVAVSIKHTEYRWKFGMPMVLWGHRTKDEEKRSFGGYTQYPNNAEVYSLEDWQKSGYRNCDWMKVDEPVQLCVNFCKKYKQYDTVLVSLEQYIAYCKVACLPLDRPKED